MLDLKPYHDAVLAADAEVQRIANEIHESMQQGTDEGTTAALALRPALDAAQAKHAETAALYESIQKANRPNDAAKNFVPVLTEAEQPESQQPTIITREAYNQLSLVDRAKFVRSGGSVSDKIS